MTATPPASWISSIACSAVGQRRGTKALAPGTRYSSKKGPRSPVAPAARAMWGRPIESASPASRTASSRCRSKPSPRSFSTISPARVTPLVLGALAGAGDLPEVDPVAADVEVFGVLVHAGHLDRRHQLDPEPLGRGLPPRRPRRSRRGRSAPAWSTPASAAFSTTSAGGSWPSETVEWLCSSISIGGRLAGAGRPEFVRCNCFCCGPNNVISCSVHLTRGLDPTNP